ncbi:LysR substrate-binding domain-containing protein [Williamsia sp.]|uniref:LysR family transcriptional regulator n=1 Tax=Williamsia sp. TaxID=1872085 RepID=UPI001A22DC4B|nr:LysR substrate-binding domain-containing protein [Williamsia sp.]MBJ7288179.1 LysR family transcriptional regulator [Williamsia sp.]
MSIADVDLRKLRYFVAVADELHFGRAAERLHIAQPVLSRQIRAFEDELGVELFDRDRRGTRLTVVGQQLLDDARPLLAASEALTRRVRAAAEGGVTLTIGFMPGITLTSVIGSMRSRYPDLATRLLRTSWDDQVQVLHDGRADISIVRLPIDRTGLEVHPLFDEPRVAMVPADHPLAHHDRIVMAELADDHLLQDPGAVPEWRAVATEMRGGERRSVPPIGSVEEKLELVAQGQGIAVIPASTAAFYTRHGVVSLTVDDLGPNHVAVAWPTGRRTRLVLDFAETAAALLPEHP